MGGNFDYGKKFIQRIDLGAKTKITDIAGRMTQELFDSIQLERLKVGEELESAALDTFLKYPEFALNYSSRLESDLITSNTISSDDAEENFKQLYEKMRHSIYAKFQYDIGA